MKNNPYYLDFEDQKGMTLDQVHKIKENNHAMVIALNHFARAVKQGPDAIRRFRKQLGSHDIVKYPDSETGMNTYDFTNRLRFLASKLENDKAACVDYANLSNCGKALSYLFAGYVYTESNKDFCDKYCRWKEYKTTDKTIEAFKNRDPLGIALYIQKKEDVMPIGLDYAHMLSNIVTGENGEYQLKLDGNDDGKVLNAVEEQIFALKTNETFYNNYYNDYYSQDDDEIVKGAIVRRNRDHKIWEVNERNAQNPEVEEERE